MDHCKQVFCELFATPALTFVVVCLIEKDESGAGSVDNPFKQLDTESGETVTVGHHNFVDQSFLDVFQKPRETFALVVETGRGVFVDFVLWEVSLHCLDLSSKIVFLFTRGNSTIDGTLFLFVCVVIICMCVQHASGSASEVCGMIGRVFCVTYTCDVEASMPARGEL